MLKKIKNFFSNLIFPIRCVACQTEGEWFCTECLKKIQLNAKQFCPHCGCISSGGAVCYDCAESSALSGLRVAAGYEKNPELAQAIKILKYHFSEPLAENLGKLLVKVIQIKNYSNERIVVPVPLHKKRERYRGFNQAELLAELVAEELKLPLEKALCRIRNTPQQAKLKRRERLVNLQNAFELTPQACVTGKTVLLIDDVASTGATLEECAKTLRLGGAKEVWGLVLARG